MTYRKKPERQLNRERRKREDRQTNALLEKLVDLNPGLAHMTCEEFTAILDAYIRDIEAGRDPAPPFIGMK